MNELSKLHGLSADDMTAEVILDLTAQHAGTGGSMMTTRRGTNRTARWSEVNALFAPSDAQVEANQDSSLDNVPLDRLHAAERRGRMRAQRSPQLQQPRCGICAVRGDEATGLMATCRECGDSYHVKCLKGAYETTAKWHECFEDTWVCPGCAQRAGVAAILGSEADTEWPEFVHELVRREQKDREERGAAADEVAEEAEAMAAPGEAGARSLGDPQGKAAADVLRQHIDAAIKGVADAAAKLKDLEDRFSAANETQARLTLMRERGVAVMDRLEDALAEVDVDLEVVRQQLMQQQALEVQEGRPVGTSAGVIIAQRAVLENRTRRKTLREQRADLEERENAQIAEGIRLKREIVRTRRLS